MEESLKELLTELSKQEILSEDMNFLSYIGDAIYELIARTYILEKYSKLYKINDLHKLNTDIVCAKSQATIIDKLIDDNILTGEEVNIYKRARNAHTKSHPKNGSIVDYRKATGLEGLLGYLFYKKNIDRIIYICKYSFGNTKFS